MPFQSRVVRQLAVVLTTLLLAATALAQTETGQITGRVTTAAGAVLPGAAIAIRAVETASERQVTTNRDGIYVLPNLQPGQYEVTVTAAGFAATVWRVQVTVGSRNVQNFNLAIAPANAPTDKTKQVVLIGPDVTVEQSTQALSTVFNEKQLRELPTLTRNVYDLLGISRVRE